MAAYAGEKRPADGSPVADAADILKITPLGAGNEVGRSCIMIEYKKKTIMVRRLAF
jgi:cleavage and polyadenylation specificity factor subunit 3